MRIRITSEGIDDLAIGTEFTLSNVPPASWAGKYVIVDDKTPNTYAVNKVAGVPTLDASAGSEFTDAEEKPRRNRKDSE